MAAPRQRSGLGRGLGDLIRPTTPEEAPQPTAEVPDTSDLVAAPPGAGFGDNPVDQIVPNP